MYLTKFNLGRLYPKVQPLTLLYTILAEKVPFLYTFYIPTLGSLVIITYIHTYIPTNASLWVLYLEIYTIRTMPSKVEIEKLLGAS